MKYENLKNMKLHEVVTFKTWTELIDSDKRREFKTSVMKVEGGYIYRTDSWVGLAQIGKVQLTTTDATSTSVFVPEI